MGKFTIKLATEQYVPEDNGWHFVSESIPEPTPKYKLVSKGMASGYSDMSTVAMGSVVYESRTIEVTFARFKHGVDGWLDEVETTANSIKTIFGTANQATIYPKTISNKSFISNAFNYRVSRDGIIQYMTMTFKCQPTGITYTTT